MILNDAQICDLAEGGMISPFVAESVKGPGGTSHGLSSCGVDIRLGDEWVVFRKPALWRRLLGRGGLRRHVNPPIDPEKPLETWRTRRWRAPKVVVPAGGFLLAHSLETVAFPRHVSAELKDKSTLARLGLSIQNTIMEPGWSGQITIEIHNSGPQDVLLRAGQGIGQLIFVPLSAPCRVSYADRAGKYMHQVGTVLPRAGRIAA